MYQRCTRLVQKMFERCYHDVSQLLTLTDARFCLKIVMKSRLITFSLPVKGGLTNAVHP